MAEGKIHEKGEIGLPEILADFKSRLGDGVGAIGSFIGIVRGEAKVGGKVERLRYESVESAGEELENIAADVEEDIDGISEVAIHHLVDDLEPGDEIVYLLVGGNHRKEVFEALPRIMDRVKDEVRIWKKEITGSGDYWVHEVEE